LTIGQALEFSREQLIRVQQIAGMYGLDMNQAGVGEETDWKHCTYASCAQRAFQAACLTGSDFQAPSNIYQGEAGVNRFFPHAETLFDPPPDLERIVFKRWPALVFCQTPVDVALDLAQQVDNLEAIRHVTVKTYEVAFRNGALLSAHDPKTRAGRTHSIPYCVATALRGTIEYQDFDEPAASRSELRNLMQKIEVVKDPDIEKLYPQKSGCVIEICMNDGKTFSAERDYPKGDPQDPLSDEEIEDKLRKYGFFFESSENLDKLIQRIWHIEEERHLDWLIAPLKKLSSE
jgi:2-methylcitrate dehydratase